MLSLLATIDFEDGHPPQAVARLEPVIADLDTGEPDAVLAEVAGQLGRFLIFTGETERAAPYLERALTLAEVLDLPETFVQALNSKSVIAMQRDRLRESRILLEGALEIALAQELHAAALRVYNNLSVLLWTVDDWKANIANIERPSSSRGESVTATGRPTSSRDRSARSTCSVAGTRRSPVPTRPTSSRRTSSRAVFGCRRCASWRPAASSGAPARS